MCKHIRQQQRLALHMPRQTAASPANEPQAQTNKTWFAHCTLLQMSSIQGTCGLLLLLL
jgi:hypothetical protein